MYDVAFCCHQRYDENRDLKAAEELKLSSLSDVEVSRLGQRGAGYDGSELEIMTADTAVAAAKKMLRNRQHHCKISFK